MKPRGDARRLVLACIAMMLVFAPAGPDRTEGGFSGLTQAELLVRSVAPADVQVTGKIRARGSPSWHTRPLGAVSPAMAIVAMALLAVTERVVSRKRVARPQSRFPRPRIPRAPPSFRFS
jgi:hypothetical protein